jgi:superfamily II DNA/RNA helicase
LILDEADKMVEMGQFKELDKILDFIYSEDQ